MLALEYYLYYKGAYQHDILLATKRELLESAIERQGESVSESLLRALELDDKAERTRNLLTSVDEYTGPSIRKIHQKTNHLWSAPKLNDDKVADLFTQDLLNANNNRNDIIIESIQDMMDGKAKPISYNVNMKL